MANSPRTNSANRKLPAPAEPPAGRPDIHELRIKELDERHLYSRFIAQAYLAWYTFFVTLNLAIMGVSLAHATEVLPYKSRMVVAFLGFNLLGILTTWIILRETTKQQAKIHKILNALVAQVGGEFKVQSPCGCSLCRFYRCIAFPTKKARAPFEPKVSIECGTSSPGDLLTGAGTADLISPYPNHLFVLLPTAFALSHIVLMGFWYKFGIDGF